MNRRSFLATLGVGGLVAATPLLWQPEPLKAYSFMPGKRVHVPRLAVIYDASGVELAELKPTGGDRNQMRSAWVSRTGLATTMRTWVDAGWFDATVGTGNADVNFNTAFLAEGAQIDLYHLDIREG